MLTNMNSDFLKQQDIGKFAKEKISTHLVSLNNKNSRADLAKKKNTPKLLNSCFVVSIVHFQRSIRKFFKTSTNRTTHFRYCTTTTESEKSGQFSVSEVMSYVTFE